MTREEKLAAVLKAYEELGESGDTDESWRSHMARERKAGALRLAFEVEDCAAVCEGSIRSNESGNRQHESGIKANEALVATETKRREVEQERSVFMARSLEQQEQHCRRFEEILREGLAGIARAIADRP